MYLHVYISFSLSPCITHKHMSAHTVCLSVSLSLSVSRTSTYQHILSASLSLSLSPCLTHKHISAHTVCLSLSLSVSLSLSLPVSCTSTYQHILSASLSLSLCLTHKHISAHTVCLSLILLSISFVPLSLLSFRCSVSLSAKLRVPMLYYVISKTNNATYGITLLKSL